MKKTIGGDRLGAGKKMHVELHNYERSTHDMGYLWRSTMSAGTLVPFMCEVALPGDTFDIDLEADIKTHPTVGPLFGSYKVQLDVFICPIRLYQAQLHNNALGIGLNMAAVKLPQIEMFYPYNDYKDNKDIDNCQINPSALLSYIGLRGTGWNSGGGAARNFNAIPLIAYWDIYKNYYSNKQEEVGAYIASGTKSTTVIEYAYVVDFADIQTTIPNWPTVGNVKFTEGYIIKFKTIGNEEVNLEDIIITVDDIEILLSELYGVSWTYDDIAGTTTGYCISTETRYINNYRVRNANDIGSTVQVKTFPLNNIDTIREDILKQSKLNPYTININTIDPYGDCVRPKNGDTTPGITSTQQGLGLKTYQSDLFNNWLSTEWIDGENGISAVTAISTAGDEFTLDTLNLAKKVYNMLNRIAVSGGTYDDWLDAVYMHDRYTKTESPIYIGGLSKELVFQEVISNAQAGDEPLGSLAGRGVLGNKHKGGKIVARIDEPSYILGIISLTPRLDYSQGNKWDVNLKTMDDFHKPALDEIGFQDLITEQMAWWTTERVNSKWVQKSAGKQPAWINYMTNVNQVRGNFAMKDNEMFMTLNRRYEKDEVTNDIRDLTTYIDPSKFNFIFADTARDSQNFWAQIAVDITARRKMSAKIMPNI